MSGLAHLKPQRVNTLSEVQGYTERSRLPMQLMFNQPNNMKRLNLNLKLESFNNVMDTWNEVLKERANALNFVLTQTMQDFRSLFRIDNVLVHEIGNIPYTVLANVDLPNVIGLKADIHTYAKKLDLALTLANAVLEFELPSLQKLVGQLIADKDALTSVRPISSLTEVKMHSQDVEKTKTELAAMIGQDTTQQFVKFGSIYYSIDEWKNCTKLVQSISLRLKKIKMEKFSKDVKNLTVLMDRLIMRSQNEKVPQSNIETYASVIEDSSNNIAFAGAVIHMCETLLTVMEQHNEIIKVELDDYKKNPKR